MLWMQATISPILAFPLSNVWMTLLCRKKCRTTISNLLLKQTLNNTVFLAFRGMQSVVAKIFECIYDDTNFKNEEWSTPTGGTPPGAPA
jgi:hypothetical protein